MGEYCSTLQPLSGNAGHGQDWLYKAIDCGDLHQIQSQFAPLTKEDRLNLVTTVVESNGEPPLHRATWLGHCEILKLLISEDCKDVLSDMTSVKKGWSCLHFAAAGGHLDIVQWLLESCGANVTLGDNEKNTPLHLAVSAGHKNMVPLLVREAGNILTLNEGNMMPISYCKDESMFEALLSASINAAGPSVVRQPASQVDAERRTILHYAAQFAKDPDVILKLIINNINCWQQEDSQEDTFLHVAAKCGKVQVLQALRKLGPGHEALVAQLLQVGAANPDRTSPGMHALLQNHEDFFNELITFDGVKITLSCIIEELVVELADHPGIKDRLRLFAGTLPTYLALYAKKNCIFKLLLESGTLSLSQWDDEYKRTCLHWAIEDEQMEIVEVLSDHVHLLAKIEDRDGKIPLHLAFGKENHMVFEALRFKYPGLREQEEMLFRDRNVYVQSLNAFLVGAAVTAGVTFAGWLQLPSGEKFKSGPMKIFWACNSMSFFLAVAAMWMTMFALLPTQRKYVGETVNQIWLAIQVDAIFLFYSLAFVVIAFGAAGFEAILQFHDYRYRVLMWITAWIGGVVCGIVGLAFLFRLYRHHISKTKTFALLFLRPSLSWADWLFPASVYRKLQSYHGRSSRHGYPTKKNLEDCMGRDLVEDYRKARARLQLCAQHDHASVLQKPASINRSHMVEAIEKQFDTSPLPGIDVSKLIIKRIRKLVHQIIEQEELCTDERQLISAGTEISSHEENNIVVVAHS